MYHQVLTIRNYVFCPHSVFTCFVWISEQTAIISLYNINWLVFITETECVYCAVRTGCLYIIQVMCFVWISEQTAIISLYSINWLVYITEMEIVYCAVWTGYLNVIRVKVNLRSAHIVYLCVSHGSQGLIIFGKLGTGSKERISGNIPL
jgi:hypothetical protein